MTDFIYKLPMHLVSKNGRVYKDAIYKSASKLLKKKKLFGTVGHPVAADIKSMAFDKATPTISGDIEFISIDNDDISFKLYNTELPANYANMFELSPVYLLEDKKVTLLYMNLIPKAVEYDRNNK